MIVCGDRVYCSSSRFMIPCKRIKITLKNTAFSGFIRLKCPIIRQIIPYHGFQIMNNVAACKNQNAPLYKEIRLCARCKLSPGSCVFCPHLKHRDPLRYRFYSGRSCSRVLIPGQVFLQQISFSHYQLY